MLTSPERAQVSGLHEPFAHPPLVLAEQHTAELGDEDFDETAETLENAYDHEVKVLALTITDREGILLALDDPPDGLADEATA